MPWPGFDRDIVDRKRGIIVAQIHVHKYREPRVGRIGEIGGVTSRYEISGAVVSEIGGEGPGVCEIVLHIKVSARALRRHIIIERYGIVAVSDGDSTVRGSVDGLHEEYLVVCVRDMQRIGCRGSQIVDNRAVLFGKASPSGPPGWIARR